MSSVISNWRRMGFAIVLGLLCGCDQSIIKPNVQISYSQEKTPLKKKSIQSLSTDWSLSYLKPSEHKVVVKGVSSQLAKTTAMMATLQAKAKPKKIKLLQSSVQIKGGQTAIVAYTGTPVKVSSSSRYLQNIVLVPGKLQLTAKKQSGVEKVVFEFGLPDGSISRVNLKITVQGSEAQMDYRWYPESVRKAITEELEVLRLTNLVRKKGTKCGQKFYPAVPALVWNDTLAHAARNHAVDMGKRGYFDHNTPEGVEFSKRMTAAGYLWHSAGENIAAGQPTPQQVVNAWMKSKGHCTNLMSADFKELGVGMIKHAGSTYGIYWGQNFGAQQ